MQSSTLDYLSDLSLRKNLELYQVDQEIENLQNATMAAEKKNALASQITALLEVDTMVSMKKQGDKDGTTDDYKPSQDLYYPPPNGTTKKRSIFSQREKNQAILKGKNSNNVVMVGATMVVPTSKGMNEDDNIAMVQSIHYEDEMKSTDNRGDIPVDAKLETSEQQSETSDVKKKRFLFF